LFDRARKTEFPHVWKSRDLLHGSRYWGRVASYWRLPAMRVLIVDDNEFVRKTIRHVLAGVATEVDECTDGDEVLAHYESFSPQVVLMDVRMQRVDGISATAMLRAAHPEARVIVVSDYDQDDMRKAAREAGAEGYVTKRDLLDLQELLTERCR